MMSLTKVEARQIRQGALQALIDSDQLLNKSYLAELGCYPLQKAENYALDTVNAYTDIRIFQIERIVMENKQSVLESIAAAYAAMGAAGYTVFTLLKSDGKETILYLGTRGEAKKSSGKNAGDLLEKTFKGHFPGSRLTNMSGDTVQTILHGIRDYTASSNATAVSAVTGVPSLSVEEREHFMQGLERFIDAAEGREYQALILAKPVSGMDLNTIRIGYENAATQLSPLLKQSLSFGQNESDSIGLSISQGLSESLGVSLGLTETKGTSESITHTHTSGTSESISAQTKGAKAGIIGGAAVGAAAIMMAPVTGGISLAATGAIIGGQIGSTLFNKTNTTGTTKSTSEGTTTGSSFSSASSNTQSTTYTTSHTDTHSNTRTQGSSRQITLESTDKSIGQMLKKIDHQLERIDEGQRYGAWNTAAYFISDSTAASESLASIFFGLMRGSDSNSENFAITTWNANDCKQVLAWLGNLSHPRLNPSFGDKLPIPYLTPATLVSGKEMAIQLSLPRKSTSAVTVIEAQTFGRKIQNVNDNNQFNADERIIKLGNIRHLWNDLPQQVELKVDNLTSHLFVSGSTGSGKSNTVYEILNQLSTYNIPFMVIEPAKGEYKNIFGHRKDVAVLGTNPKHTALLKINPFKFPNEIHVLEHIDRLIEIFNVCWPMYAAMPAVLKEAMLQAYERCGWELTNSIYQDNVIFYPTFIDLLESLNQVVEQSAFSQEVKSNYIGALVTRVKSLTNGLNGQIFTADEIDNTILFDSNVIVDLSRIGSQETKSLIMGILVMRLSEYRMAKGAMNQPLKHITVLEEAHNILKRTSTEQSTEGVNVAGKAVEMLANAIAEMRTFGEGFIIADQSPNAVDISAIRNTNTKIIMRLPDAQDRRLAGKAAGTTDEQLEEIAKLPRGVAVVYQNDWLEPVLCSIKKFENCGESYSTPTNADIIDTKRIHTEITKFLLFDRLGNVETFDVEMIKNHLDKLVLPTHIKKALRYSIDEYEADKSPAIWHVQNFSHLSRMLTSLLDIESAAQKIIKRHVGRATVEAMSDSLKTLLCSSLTDTNPKLIFAVEHCVMKHLSLQQDVYQPIYDIWHKQKSEGVA